MHRLCDCGSPLVRPALENTCQHQFPLLACFDKALCTAEVEVERLFNQHVQTGIQCADRL